MSGPIAVEPDVQEAILDILPADGILALSVMAQMSANMIGCVNGADLEEFIEAIRHYHKAYEEA